MHAMPLDIATQARKKSRIALGAYKLLARGEPPCDHTADRTDSGATFDHRQIWGEMSSNKPALGRLVESPKEHRAIPERNGFTNVNPHAAERNPVAEHQGDTTAGSVAGDQRRDGPLHTGEAGCAGL